MGRGAGAAFAFYSLALVALFLLSSPFTLGKNGSVASGDPPAWAQPAFESLLAFLPVALVLGAAVAAWPWSGKAGRATIVAGVLLLGGFFAMDWLSTPSGFDTVDGAESFGRTAAWLLSLATVALLAAVAILVKPPARAPADAP